LNGAAFEGIVGLGFEGLAEAGDITLMENIM